MLTKTTALGVINNYFRLLWYRFRHTVYWSDDSILTPLPPVRHKGTLGWVRSFGHQWGRLWLLCYSSKNLQYRLPTSAAPSQQGPNVVWYLAFPVGLVSRLFPFRASLLIQKSALVESCFSFLFPPLLRPLLTSPLDKQLWIYRHVQHLHFCWICRWQLNGFVY